CRTAGRCPSWRGASSAPASSAPASATWPTTAPSWTGSTRTCSAAPA
ncbi:MAG: hypothetical protein AVDCRST_MAG27-891, partial [uncultured Craurococcus sp.]